MPLSLRARVAHAPEDAGAGVTRERAPDGRIITQAQANARLAPFWLDDIGLRPRHPRHCGPALCDLAVVGSGYTGLWTALQAFERYPGARVIVPEVETIGWAASEHNGGFCEPSLTHVEANGLTRFPREL